MDKNKIDIVVDLKNAATKGLTVLQAQLKSLETGALSAGRGLMSGLGNSLEYILNKAKQVGVGIGAALIGLGTFGVKSAGDVQESAVAFEVLLGSMAKAKSLMSELSTMAAQTPFEFPELADTAKMLLSYGISQEKIIRTTRMLGDLSMGNASKLQVLGLAYGQVAAKGKLMGTEVLQFTNAGIPLIDKLAKSMGKTRAQVEDMVTAGEIGFPQVQKVIEQMTDKGGLFYDMMNKQARTFKGMVSTAKDTFGQFARAIVGMSNDGTIKKGSIFALLNQQLDKLVNGSSPQKIVALGELIGTKLANASVKAIPLVKALFSSIIKGTNESDALSKIFGTTIGNTLNGALQILHDKLKAVANVFKGLWDVISSINWQPLLDVLGQLFVIVNNLVTGALNVFAKWLKDNRQQITDFINTVLVVFKNIWDGINAAIKTVGDTIQNSLKFIGELIQSIKDGNPFLELLLFILGGIAIALATYGAILGIATLVSWGFVAAIAVANLTMTILGGIIAVVLSPITLLGIAFGVVAFIVYQVVQHWNSLVETIANFSIGGTKVRDILGGIWDVMKSIGNVIGTVLKPAVEGLGSAFSGLLSFLKPVLDALTNIERLGKAFSGDAPQQKEWIEKAKAISGKAVGTIYSEGGPTMINERGPEIVTLPRGAQVTPHNVTNSSSDNRNITINVNGAMNPSAIIDEIKRYFATDNIMSGKGLNNGLR